MPAQVKVRSDDQAMWTEGLARLGKPELVLPITDRSLDTEARDLLQSIAEYATDPNVQLKDGETLGYGYWHVRFTMDSDGRLALWEYTADATRYVPGAELTLTYWREQQALCAAYGADFSPPRPDQLVAINEGVYEGEPVDGVRYPAPPHMSGWYICTDRYDGDITQLMLEHCYHLTVARPDLARYLALPPGFCFDLIGEEPAVWFDEEAYREGLASLEEAEDEF